MSFRRVLAGAVAASVLAGCGVKYATVRTDKGEDLMLLGHDPVAYFTVGKPVRGYPAISTRHNEVTYYFASEANRAMFVADPAKYAPQYGAFCADGAAYGVKKREVGKAIQYTSDRERFIASGGIYQRTGRSSRGY